MMHRESDREGVRRYFHFSSHLVLSIRSAGMVLLLR